jgi:hypothetical protein
VIVGSLLLILVAVVSLGLGLARGSNALLIGSIVASLLAAIALIVGARKAAAGRTAVADDGYDEVESSADAGLDETRVILDEPIDLVREAARRRDGGTTYGSRVDDDREPGDVEPEPGERGPLIPTQARLDQDDDELDEDFLDEDPPDEPPAQLVQPADAARVARMSTEVLVIDGRPRYHLAGCVHLLGRDGEPLPVSEAVELGFTPCSLCEPDSALVAEARRV